MTSIQIIDNFRVKGISTLGSYNEKTLSNLLKEANDLYYNEVPVMTDNEYDIIKEYIEKKWPLNTEIQKIGAIIVSGRKVVLPYFMPSMNKIKPDTGVLDKWKNNYIGPYVLSHKLDGVSCLLVIGKERKLYTRGDGRVGQDISHLIPYLGLSINKLNGFDKGIIIRGELLIPKKTFQEKFAVTFANPRNMVAGLVNQKADSFDIETVKNIHLVAYEILFPEKLQPSEQMRILKKLCDFGLKKVESYNCPKSMLTNEYLSGILLESRAKSIYEIDGIICADDSGTVYERQDKNPEHSFAFKMVLTEQIAEAKVVDVIWTASKDGYLKPRVRIEPISLGGVCIEYATGFNASFIEKNNIGVGAVVEIIRSGDVIPHIKCVLSGCASGAKMPLLDYQWNSTHVDIRLNDKDLAEDLNVREKILTSFFQGIEVVGLSHGQVIRLISNGHDTVPKILKMDLKDWLGIDGFQEKNANKMYNGIRERLTKVKIIDIMSASNIFGRGFSMKKLGSIMDVYSNEILTLVESREVKIQKVLAVNGIAMKSASAFVDGIEPFLLFLKETGLTGFLKEKEQEKEKEQKQEKEKEKEHELNEKTIVMTGVRDDILECELKKIGVKLGCSVSKKTFILLVKDDSVETVKTKAAKELGIQIMSIPVFREKYL